MIKEFRDRQEGDFKGKEFPLDYLVLMMGATSLLPYLGGTMMAFMSRSHESKGIVEHDQSDKQEG